MLLLCFSSLEQFQEEFEDISKEEQVSVFFKKEARNMCIFLKYKFTEVHLGACFSMCCEQF